MLRVSARPSTGQDDEDIDAAGNNLSPIMLHSLDACVSCGKLSRVGYIYLCDCLLCLLSWLAWQAREDLAKLQRQFKVTEGSRKQNSELAQNMLKKQQWVAQNINPLAIARQFVLLPWQSHRNPYVSRAMIEALQVENADLKKNLSLAGSKQNGIKDQQVAAKLEELILSHSTFI